MRVAYIVGTFPSPSETFVVTQIVGVAARGHEVDVFTVVPPEGGAQAPMLGADTLRLRTCPLYVSGNRLATFARAIVLVLFCGWRAPRVVRRALSRVQAAGPRGALRLIASVLELVRHGSPQYDVIHAQFGPYGLLAAELVKVGALRGPIVTSFRGYDAGKDLQANLPAYRELFQFGPLFLPVSHSLARRLVAVGCDPTRIQVHRSGISVASLRFAPRADRSGDVTKLITVGRLVEKKGVRYAIEAAARVLKGGRRVQYLIVGDGPLRAELEEFAHQLGMKGHITFAGWKAHDEALLLLENADILVVPSVTAADGDEEGIPNVAKEAMAMGLPVLATRHGGIPELIEDGVSGLLVPERDSTALAGRLVDLIDHPERWAGMGEAGRRRIEAEYDIERLNDELVALYRGLSGSRDTAAARAAKVASGGAAG